MPIGHYYRTTGGALCTWLKAVRMSDMGGCSDDAHIIVRTNHDASSTTTLAFGANLYLNSRAADLAPNIAEIERSSRL
jgi:hypothetical protein